MRIFKRSLWILAAACLISGCAVKYHKNGVEYLENKEYGKAITEFERSIEEEEYVSDSFRGIGIAYWEQGAYEQAEEAFEKALKFSAESEKDSVLFYFLGALNMKKEDWESAITYYRQGLKKDDCTVEMKQEMWFNIIYALEKQEDWQGAKEELDAYIQMFPEDETARKEAEFLGTRL